MLDAVATIAGTGLLAMAAVSIAALLRVRGPATLVAACLVLGASVVVLSTIVLSLFDAFTRSGLLAAEAVFAVAGTGAWLARGRRSRRPPADGPEPGLGGLRRPSWRDGWSAARAQPAVAVLVGAAALAMLVQLVMAIAVAPSNWDSMTYHLSRAAYWLQDRSAEHFPGGSVRQLDSPPNGEILQAWTMAMSGGDRLVAVVQWLSLLGVACCIYTGARLLRFGRGPALFAAALFAVLPQPILQASSTQNDLITALFVVATGVFGARGLRDRHAGDLAIAALAAGLAVGTKGTALALAPALAIVLVAAARGWRTPPRLVATAAAGTVVAILALGSFGYILNAQAHGSPFGDIAGKTQRESPPVANAVRVLWTFADLPGVAAPWVNSVTQRVVNKIGADRFQVPNQFAFGVDSAISEDTSAFGPVGWLLLLPLLIAFAFGRRAGPARYVALAGLVAIAGFAVAFEYNIWVGRLLLPAVAIAAPLFAALAVRNVVAGLTATLALIVLAPCLLQNPSKPLLPDLPAPTILHRDRLAQMTITRPEMAGVVSAVDQRLGSGGTLAFAGDEDSWDYPFFGPHLERRIVRFRAPATLTPAQLRRAGAQAVLFANVPPRGRFPGAKQVVPGYWLAPVG
jgi:hypothetical protein